MGRSGNNRDFRPVFVVGAPRSGTTLLAVLLNRHSSIAFPPETQFLTEFLPAHIKEFAKADRREKVRLALGFQRIADLGLEEENVLKSFELHSDTEAALLRAILETYAEKEGKHIPGEKSPGHLEYVPELLSHYPAARVICIIRDGRDVVRSLMKTSWAEPGNPRRFGLFCMKWIDYARLAEKYRKKFPETSFKAICYEDLLTYPEAILKDICDFLEVDFERKMLEVGECTPVVPAWESQWKEKAADHLDPSRAFAWQKGSDPKEVWRMNSMMGRELRYWDYPEVNMDGCPLLLKLSYRLKNIPYARGMRGFSLLGLKVSRILRS